MGASQARSARPGGKITTAGESEEIHPPYPGNPFASMSVNGGARAVISHIYQNQQNLTMGFCSITPYGHFDYTKGGHIILYKAEVIIECLPDYTVFIPSATCIHFNLLLHDPKHETHGSIIHYLSAGLF